MKIASRFGWKKVWRSSNVSTRLVDLGAALPNPTLGRCCCSGSLELVQWPIVAAYCLDTRYASSEARSPEDRCW
jgi:hypothetical protein